MTWQTNTQLSLGAFPWMTPVEAMKSFCEGSWAAGFLPKPSISQVQICPQNKGMLTQEILEFLKKSYPGTQFRLHANARVREKHLYSDLSSMSRHQEYWKSLASAQSQLGAIAYSAHPGRKSECSLEQLFNHAKKASDLFGCRVAIEGMYPSIANHYLISSWKEYAILHESGCDFALDLSHINILATKARVMDRSLVKEMLASDRCLEIHISSNDGLSDQHKHIEHEEWWFELMPSAHPDAAIFNESFCKNGARNVVFS